MFLSLIASPPPTQMRSCRYVCRSRFCAPTSWRLPRRSCLIEHVESPQPFILGVHTDWLADIAPDALEEVTARLLFLVLVLALVGLAV